MIVGLADKLVEEPWQKLWAPEKVTVGISYTFTINRAGELVPAALLAVQTSV